MAMTGRLNILDAALSSEERPALRGTVLGVVCDGPDLKQLVADGYGGHTYKLFKKNHGPCGGYPSDIMNHPVEGSVLGYVCQDSTRMAQVADGRGGMTWSVVEKNSPECIPANKVVFTPMPTSINSALMPPALQGMDSVSLPQIKL